VSAKKLLFLCVANSARSQLAEALAKKFLGAGWEVYSAGTKPTEVQPLVATVLKEMGIEPHGLRAKSVESFDLAEFEMVITLCGEEICPALTGIRPRQFHWPLPDPVRAELPPEDQLDFFRNVRDTIKTKLENGLAEGLFN